MIRRRREEFGLTLPAVVLTGFGMEEDVTRSRAAGFNAHLTKPLNFSTLEETIRRVCAKT